jgi:hypothetical protein
MSDATVVVSLAAVNDAPVTMDDAASTDEDMAVTVGVCANDMDIDGDALTVAISLQPANGTALVDNNQVVYTPNLNFFGTDTLIYTVDDQEGADPVPAMVEITVAPVNDAPVAIDDAVVTDEDTNITVNVLANDSDVENDVITLLSAADAVNGTVAVVDDSVVFTPYANVFGTGSFSYVVADPGGLEDTGLVTVTITSVNDVPVADAQTVEAVEDTPITIVLTGSDVESASLTWAIASAPSAGNLGSIVGNSVEYTPDAHVYGTDSFTFTASDGDATSPAATVMINVAAVNDVPMISVADSHYISGADQSMVFEFSVGDFDNDLPGLNDIASVTLDLTPVGGLAAATITAGAIESATNQVWFYTFDSTGVAPGTYSLTATVEDAAGETATQVFMVEVLSGTVFRVGADQDYSTIQSAIDASSNGDFVVIYDGTYSGAGNKNLLLGGKQITVRSESGTATDVVIDCEDAGRAFNLPNSGETLATQLYAISIENASASAIFLQGPNAALTIEECHFDGNENIAGNGGALNVFDGADLTVRDSQFTDNAATDGEGGALYMNSGLLVLTGTSFRTNRAEGDGASNRFGGACALYQLLSAAIDDCNFV